MKQAVPLCVADAASAYLAAGLCVLPAMRTEKRPAIGAWKPYQKRLPTAAELSAWMARNPNALCIICGAVSSNLETIDFDDAEAFAKWYEKISAELCDRLVIEKTPSGGFHVIYRCEAPVCGNLKLAQRKGGGGTVTTLIETRGEGGLFLCAPTKDYELMQGDMASPPVLTVAERDVLLHAAWELNEYEAGELRAGGDTAATQRPVSRAANGGGRLLPGQDFAARGDLRPILRKHGWMLVGDDGENEKWRRPGKDGAGHSATLNTKGVFYVFSSNAAPFESNRGYGPFQVYTLLEHGDDEMAAAGALRAEGYGDPHPHLADETMLSDEQLSGILGQFDDEGDSDTPSRWAIQTLGQLIAGSAGLHRPIIHGLLREGETMNIIASPKTGKSWFVCALTIAIASGLDWLGMQVEQGRVLHIDNELHRETIGYRYRQLSEAMDVPIHLFGEQIHPVSLRGKLRDLKAMGELFASIEPGEYKVVILDAFYRTLPADTDENDNGAIAGLYNLIDQYAAYLQCAFVLIHHTTKGNQSGKSVTDVGAGAGSQSRAADTHLVLRPHEDDDVVVLESVARSWPPLPAMTLNWQWPLFIPNDEADPTALWGAAKSADKRKQQDVTLDEYVEHCVANNDPCSANSVRYDAEQHFGLSRRRAEEMLDLAIEQGKVAKIRTGPRMQYVKMRPVHGGEKSQWAAALLVHDPESNVNEIAEKVGASVQHIRRVRRSMPGAQSEHGANMDEHDVRAMFAGENGKSLQ